MARCKRGYPLVDVSLIANIACCPGQCFTSKVLKVKEISIVNFDRFSKIAKQIGNDSVMFNDNSLVHAK
jgi:hypothetical protein